LAIAAIGTAMAVLGYLSASVFWTILVVSLLHSFALAPTTNLADALALVASSRGGQHSFEYGWVRGAGAGAFIVGSLIAGVAIALYGLGVIICLQALLMLCVPLAASLVPPVATTANQPDQKISHASVLALARLPAFRRVV